MIRDGGVERLRGFYDVWYDEQAAILAVEETLNKTLALHGYLPVDVPVLERSDLFLRKNGAEVAGKLYSFEDLGRRDVSLRPEFTASIIRAAAEHVHDVSLPIRVSYCGPAFRYEKPQRGTMRQFTQLGVELLGSDSLAADIELVRLACAATEAAGVHDYSLTLGHLGFVTQLLSRLGLEGHYQHFLIENMEYYNRGPQEQADVHERLGLTGMSNTDNSGAETALIGIVNTNGVSPEDIVDENVAKGSIHSGEATLETVATWQSDHAHNLVATVLSGTEVNLGGSTRGSDEILSRLLRKMQRRDEHDRLRQALSFISRVGTLTGPPDTVLAGARALIQEMGLDSAPLRHLEAVVDALAADGFDWSSGRGQLSLGLARGIPYYSGIIFEIHAPAPASVPEGGRAPLQLCGGGRYDGLARTLTRRLDVPALGFAFGIERLALAVAAQNSKQEEELPRRLVIMGMQHADDAGLTLRAARELRSAGIPVDLDHDGRSLRSLIQRARRLRAPVVVVADGRSTPALRLHHLVGANDSDEGVQRIGLDELVRTIGAMLAAGETD